MNNFNKRFERADKRFNIMFFAVATMIALVFVAVLAWFAFVIHVAAKSADTVSEVGIRGAVEKLWCGKQPNCSLPSGAQQ